MPIEVLVPEKTLDSTMDYNVSSDLIEGCFDYLFTSLYSVPLIDQPGYGGCVYTGIAKLTHNTKVHSIINDVCEVMGFPKLIHLSDTHV